MALNINLIDEINDVRHLSIINLLDTLKRFRNLFILFCFWIHIIEGLPHRQQHISQIVLDLSPSRKAVSESSLDRDHSVFDERDVGVFEMELLASE